MKVKETKSSYWWRVLIVRWFIIRKNWIKAFFWVDEKLIQILYDECG